MPCLGTGQRGTVGNNSSLKYLGGQSAVPLGFSMSNRTAAAVFLALAAPRASGRPGTGPPAPLLHPPVRPHRPRSWRLYCCFGSRTRIGGSLGEIPPREFQCSLVETWPLEGGCGGFGSDLAGPVGNFHLKVSLGSCSAGCHPTQTSDLRCRKLPGRTEAECCLTPPSGTCFSLSRRQSSVGLAESCCAENSPGGTANGKCS